MYKEVKVNWPFKFLNIVRKAITQSFRLLYYYLSFSYGLSCASH